jgi:hypothetical protein
VSEEALQSVSRAIDTSRDFEGAERISAGAETREIVTTPMDPIRRPGDIHEGLTEWASRKWESR